MKKFSVIFAAVLLLTGCNFDPPNTSESNKPVYENAEPDENAITPDAPQQSDDADAAEIPAETKANETFVGLDSDGSLSFGAYDDDGSELPPDSENAENADNAENPAENDTDNNGESVGSGVQNPPEIPPAPEDDTPETAPEEIELPFVPAE